MKIHGIVFYPCHEDWFDVVIDFEKDHPEPVGVDSVEFRGWVRWLTLIDQPVNFILVANRKTQFRFGVMNRVDFEAFLARLRDKGCINVRLALNDGKITARRTCTVPCEAIDHGKKTPWPPRLT